MVPEILVREYSGLPDSIGVRVPLVEYENLMLLMAQQSRNTGLKPENIQGYDVLSLSRCSGVLPEDAIVSLYRNMVRPWLRQHEEQLMNLGVSFEDIAQLKQEIAACSTGTEKTTSPKKNLWPSIAGIGRRIGKPTHRFISARRLAPVLCRFLCSIPALCRNLIRAQDDAYDTLSPDFRGIKDDPSLLSYRKRGFILHKTCNLQDAPFLPYKINAKRGSVYGVLLALVIEGLEPRGIVAVAAVSQSARIAGYAMMPVSLIDPEKPVEFFFEPPLKAGRYYFIVRGEKLNAPVYILEFEKHRVIKKPFFRLVLA
jgi:hypothetical protein